MHKKPPKDQSYVHKFKGIINRTDNGQTETSRKK